MFTGAKTVMKPSSQRHYVTYRVTATGRVLVLHEVTTINLLCCTEIRKIYAALISYLHYLHNLLYLYFCNVLKISVNSRSVD